MTVLADASLLVGDFVASGGLAADCAIMVALPVLGAVLAVVRIVVLALLTFLHLTKPSVPEDTPVEKFLKNTAHPFIDGLTPQPKPSLTYLAPAQVTADAISAQVPITGTNHTGADVALTCSTITLEVGAGNAALFSGPTTAWTVAGKHDPGKPSTLSVDGTIGVAGESAETVATGYLAPQDRGNNLVSYDLSVQASPTTNEANGLLIVKAGQSIEIA